MSLKLMLLSSLFLFVGACHNGGVSNSSNIQNKVYSARQSFPSSSIYNLGGTYDTSSGMPTQYRTCSIYGDNLNNLQIISSSAKIDFSQSVDSRTVKKAMGFDFEAQINLGIKKIKIAQHYAKTTTDDNLHMNINYVYKNSGKAIFANQYDIQGKKMLNNDALNALNSSSEKFRIMCGDKFISELDAGIVLMMKLTLNFTSHTEKKSFDANTSNLGGLQGVLAKLRQKHKGTKFTMTATGLQLGGQPDKLNQLFIAHGGSINENGAPVLNCGDSNGDNKNCAELMDKVIDYATTLKNQIRDNSDYYYSSPVLSSWSQIGINTEIPETLASVKNAMFSLNLAVESDTKRLDFIRHYQQLIMNTPNVESDFIQRVNDVYLFYDRLIAEYDGGEYQLANHCGAGYLGNFCAKAIANVLDRRNEMLKHSENLVSLTNYLMDNFYSAKLMTNIATKEYSLCDISPSSFMDKYLFMVNCEGQITNLGINGLIIVGGNNDITINNLKYHYKDELNTDVFNYDFRGHNRLNKDVYFGSIYSGEASISSNLHTIQAKPMELFKNQW